MEEKKKKLRYTTLQNLRYALSKWWGWDSRGLVQAFSRIPCVVLIPLMGILLPREVINCVTEGRPMGGAVTLVVYSIIAPGMRQIHCAREAFFAVRLKNRMVPASVGGKDLPHSSIINAAVRGKRKRRCSFYIRARRAGKR